MMFHWSFRPWWCPSRGPGDSCTLGSWPAMRRVRHSSLIMLSLHAAQIITWLKTFQWMRQTDSLMWCKRIIFSHLIDETPGQWLIESLSSKCDSTFILPTVVKCLGMSREPSPWSIACFQYSLRSSSVMACDWTIVSIAASDWSVITSRSLSPVTGKQSAMLGTTSSPLSTVSLRLGPDTLLISSTTWHWENFRLNLDRQSLMEMR